MNTALSPPPTPFTASSFSYRLNITYLHLEVAYPSVEHPLGILCFTELILKVKMEDKSIVLVTVRYGENKCVMIRLLPSFPVREGFMP